MLVLALDTTMRAGSCALARDGVLEHELASDPSKSHAEHLPGDLMALLQTAQLNLDAIDVFAVATGPGSFTGLRVGIATMQGLAFATGKPLIGVSALDALATVAEDRVKADVSIPTLVATWIDAWRGEVFAALYENRRALEGPTVEHPATVLGRLSQPDHQGKRRRVLFVGDGAATFTELIRSTLGDHAVLIDPVAPLLAGAIASLATDTARAGAHPPPHAIRPLYVRRTDAELARDARARQ